MTITVTMIMTITMIMKTFLFNKNNVIHGLQARDIVRSVCYQLVTTTVITGQDTVYNDV